MTYTSMSESIDTITEKRIDYSRIPLAKQVKTALEHYFEDLDGHTPSDLYRMVLSEIEKPLLEKVMQETRGNQSKAAEMLGLNRSTLRKKLQQYDLY
jgi:Fis family transcriptional regulator